MNLQNARKHLQAFDFPRLFVEELGWSNPSSAKSVPMAVKGIPVSRREVAQLSGVVVIEVVADDGVIPDAIARAAIHKEIAKLHHENVLIFVDAKRSQSLWYWAKRQDRKTIPRSHIFVHGQSGDLLLSKLGALAVDFADFDDSGHVPLLEVTDRLKQALDIERVTKKFYGEFQEQHVAFIELIEGINDERDRRWYASVLLNRLMFIYFLQKKFFLDGGDEFYLQNKLRTYSSFIPHPSSFYESFLKALFFEGFAKPEDKRTAEINALLGKIKYLNGGLFLPHPIELRWAKIAVPDKAFENLLALFGRYSWNLNDMPGGQDNEINPDVLGYIFEKYINQKAFGAYYTRPEITEYLCERTIHRLILDGVNKVDAASRRVSFDSVGDLLLALDAPLCKKLLHEVLPNLRLLDPACGSAAFLVSAMKTLINVYAAVIGKIDFLSDRSLQDWLKKTQKEHKSVSYFIKRSIITNNLFGVDIMEEATEIAKLRLFLALVASAQTADGLEPLPNIEFNIMAGNSLIGLMHVDDAEFEKRHPADFFRKSYRSVLEEKNDAIHLYRCGEKSGADLLELRDGIQAKKQSAVPTLNDILLAEFAHLGIKYEEATWDNKKNQEGKPKKRALKDSDIAALKPFHWGYEFDQILGDKGGFDAIITNPPWEVFEATEKEFFQEFVPEIQKKALRIEDWQRQLKSMMKQPFLQSAWLTYASSFPHAAAYLRGAPQYANQQSFDNDGRRLASKINLYKVFVEQCVNLLRPAGYCGMVIPSGIYNELGAKQLREMLFANTTVTGLFGFDNRKEIFEGVHRSFKFVALTVRKSGRTSTLPVVFMRSDVDGLAEFPDENALWVSVDLIRRLSPDSLSILEFKGKTDVAIAEKMLGHPLLGDDLPSPWTIRLAQEINMTSDNALFRTQPASGLRPLFEGKMIWQYESHYSAPRYWISVERTRKAVLGRTSDEGQILAYETFRLVFRAVGENTNERNMIATVLPPLSFCGHSIIVSANVMASVAYPLYLCGLLNSFTVDYALRMKITRNVSMFHVYQLPVPRLTEKDAAFRPIVERAARLICTTPEFDDLAKEIFGGRATAKGVGATDPAERVKLRAELDGLVAHLYGLTEEEFAYILTTFPLVPDPVKVAAHNAYRDAERGLIK